jgi:ribosomal protein L32
MWSKLRQRLSRQEKERATEAVVCKNCETEFTGHYCPHCGQSVGDYDRPISFLFYNFLGDFFAFDERFFKTTLDLVFKPGFLTVEYFAGRRVRYAPPFRIFLFTSFILFLLLQWYTNRGLKNVLDNDLNDHATFVDSALVESFGNRFIDDSVANIDLKIDFESFQNSDLRQKMEKGARVLENELKTDTDPETIRKKREIIRLLRSPDQVMARFLKYMSWAFFLLLPLYALITKLFYIRRQQNYIRHLIFTYHLHSFIFILIILITVLHLVLPFNQRGITFVLLLAVPVYSVIAMKKFYGQSYGKVILKFLGITFIYSAVFWTAVFTVFFQALGIGEFF